MLQHVSPIITDVLFHVRRLCSVRGHDVTTRLWLVTAAVLSRLDYCYTILAGLPASTLAPLQLVLHSAARSILDIKPCDDHDTTPAFTQLQWLPIKSSKSFAYWCTRCLWAVNTSEEVIFALRKIQLLTNFTLWNWGMPYELPWWGIPLISWLIKFCWIFSVPCLKISVTTLVYDL